MPNTIADTTIFQEQVILNGGFSPPLARTSLLQENLARFKIPMVAWRTHDAFQTVLPGTSSSNDLALVGGTLGSAAPSLQTADLKNAGATTNYARCTFDLPHTYVAGETVTLRLWGGMITTVASAAATIDAEVYRANDLTAVGSDICATAAQSINSLTFAAKDFTITPATLGPGDTLDIRIALLVNDSATGTAVIGAIAAAEFLLDVKG